MRIDSEYHILENPVKCDDNIINIVDRVDKDASENEEYLFSVDNELAKSLLTYIFNRNSFMKSMIILHANLDGMPVIVSKAESIVKGLASKQWRKIPLEIIMYTDFEGQSANNSVSKCQNGTLKFFIPLHFVLYLLYNPVFDSFEI